MNTARGFCFIVHCGVHSLLFDNTHDKGRGEKLSNPFINMALSITQNNKNRILTDAVEVSCKWKYNWKIFKCAEIYLYTFAHII